jgi:hypothetical protein
VRSRLPGAGRRGQATVEQVGATLLVAVVLAGAGAGLVRAGVPQAAAGAVARALGGEADPAAAPAPRLRPETYAAALAAVRREPGAYSLAGARALLAEDLGEAVGAAGLDVLVLAEARRRHAAWFDPRSALVARPGSPLGVRVTAAATGEPAVRVVTPRDEAAAGVPGARGGWAAALLSLGRDAAGVAARRLHRVAGIAVDATGLLGGPDAPAPGRLPPGQRAGDVVLCQPYVVRVSEGTGPAREAFAGVRLGVVRDGRLVRDLLADTAACG